MLVLSRQRNTAIYIGRDIKVTILSVRMGEVRLGIDAPGDVRIWRDELCRADPALLDEEDRDVRTDRAVDGRTKHRVRVMR